VSGNDLCYVIYTSGSTGTPKGAMVEHIGMLNNIANKVIDLAIEGHSRVAQTASQSFDISVWQMFIALTRGGTTVVYDDRVINDIGRFVTRLADDGITIVEMVPSYLILVTEYLAEHAQSQMRSQVRFLILTGESADATFIRRWFQHFPGTQVMNAYGPTEASDDITHHILSANDAVVNPIPVGRVLANFDIYVVDEQLNPVAAGEKGEIVVTGVGVGRGYINLAGATHKAFVESPFPDKYRGRLYRTGDVGQMREDGLLMFHGRKDQQVKVRGFRIELEEVELRILEQKSVRQAVVLDIKPPGAEAFLCACVVPYGTPDRQALLSQLEQQLPAYMIPSEFRFLERLPQLDNGKIDRKTLKEQYRAALASEVVFEPPSTEIEIRLAEIWKQVIRADRIGIRDDFFDLGGDSFKAIRIAAKYGAALEVTDIYGLRTIQALAAKLEQSVASSVRRIVRVSSRTEPARVAVLGIPNSGGDPVSFVELGKELDLLGSQIALYAVKLPRNAIDTQGGMAAEIERLTEEVYSSIANEISTPLVIFGQCNGSALAISLARRLQGSPVTVQALCIGGALLRMRETPQDRRDDREIMDFLSSIQGSLPEQPDDRAFFLSDFRYDSELADRYYNSLLTSLRAGEVQAIDAPIHCMVGSEDPLVRGYRQKFRDWQHLSGDVRLVEFAGRGHFLLRDCPRELATALRGVCLGSDEAVAAAAG
jgi:amino acid adenylation domain-containing protein